jgi:hypothetical protein
MTEEEINIAIAEHLGWYDIFLPEGDLFYIGKHPSRGMGRDYQNIPNYTRDLNAMHEAIQTLRGDDRSLLIDYLVLETGIVNAPFENEWSVFTSTPKQQAIAFLRTVGKWKEEA